MRYRSCLLPLVSLWIGLHWALSQAASPAPHFPNRPVRLIVPYPPGGGNDAIARIIAAKLTELWSQQIIIDNRSGANGIIACQIVASAAPGAAGGCG